MNFILSIFVPFCPACGSRIKLSDVRLKFNGAQFHRSCVVYTRKR
jgi:hypothetical protein